MECERCGETENVKEFVFFDNSPDEWLCWDCRYPYIQERLTGGDYDEEEEVESNDQIALGEFQ